MSGDYASLREAAGAVSLVSQGGFGYLLKDRVLNEGLTIPGRVVVLLHGERCGQRGCLLRRGRARERQVRDGRRYRRLDLAGNAQRRVRAAGRSVIARDRSDRLLERVDRRAPRLLASD